VGEKKKSTAGKSFALVKPISSQEEIGFLTMEREKREEIWSTSKGAFSLRPRETAAIGKRSGERRKRIRRNLLCQTRRNGKK